jgi:serine phosphatase RsbU (regulator of sigma subunit)
VIERGVESGDMFGPERVKAWMEAWPHGPAHEAAHDLVQRVSTFNGGAPLEDDVTVVYVHRPK